MKHLLLLHGAIGSQEQLQPLFDTLKDDFYVHRLNFYGHGGRAPESEFSIQKFAVEVLEWMDTNHLEKINLLGYSMGGYVGLYLARHHAERVEKVVTLGTKLHWDQATAIKEAGMLNPDIITLKLPRFAAELEKRHHPADWTIVLKKTAAMLLQMGEESPLRTEDFSQISSEVLLLLGDRDKMVSLQETYDVFRQLPAAQLGVLPNTPHLIDQADVSIISHLIKKFLR